jgi:putative acetyltransferase
MQHVVVQRGDPALPEVYKLIEQLDHYLTHLYRAESNHLLSLESLQQPNVTFITISIDNVIVACGALVKQDEDYAEIKRMFVLPEFRGLKIGRRLLDELESCARASGLKLIRLETGISQPEALGLYEKAGYQYCDPFGNYIEDPLSIFMEKKLA